MKSPVMFLMILAMITFETAPAFSQNISASENPLPVGSNVTLHTQATVSTGAWLFGSTMILMILPRNVIILNEWRDRVAFNSSTNHTSLTITSVQMEDSGVYTLQGVNGFRAQLTLSVQVPISNVTLRAQATDLVEFNDTAVFMCSVGSGSSLSYAWWNGSSVVTAGEGVQLSDGGATLSVRVTRHDGGPFKCNVSNGISNEISNPVQLNINYGPEMTTIMGPKMTAKGHNVTLICNASSNPPSTYKWVFNDSVVAYTSVYITPPFTSDMSGKYTCVASNNITGKTNTAYTMLTAVDVQIEAPMMLAIEGHHYNLTCNVTGSAEHVYWRKNGEFLHEDNRTVFYMGNKTVVFKPIEHTDAGTYQCWAIIDQLHVVSVPYMLRVNFGPQMPHIIGPAFAKNGSLAVFNCSAKSYPPSQFTWWFNDTMVANTSVLTTAPLSFNMSGEYTCMAYNNVTKKNNTASKNLTVTVAIESIITNSTLPINLENFTLTCEVTGPYDKIYWMKDNMYLNMNASASGKNMSYHVENNMLYFTPVTIYNEGIYKCIVTNEDRTCPSPPYELVVNYGPLSVYITGPYSANSGDRVTLTCSADSRPDCDFYWYIKHQSVILQTGPVITFSANKLTAGNYTCMARNPVTNITMYQTKRVTVGGAAALHVNCQATVMLMCTIALSFYVLFS